MADTLTSLLFAMPLAGVVIAIAAMVPAGSKAQRNLFTTLTLACIGLCFILGAALAIVKSPSRAIWVTTIGVITFAMSSALSFGICAFLKGKRW